MNLLGQLHMIDIIGYGGLVLALFCRRADDEKVALMIFIMLAQLFFTVMNNTVDSVMFQYLLAAPCDLIVIYALTTATRTTFTRDLIAINFVSLLFNAAGFLMFICATSPDLYNACMLGMMGIQVTRLIWITDDDDRTARDYRRRALADRRFSESHPSGLEVLSCKH